MPTGRGKKRPKSLRQERAAMGHAILAATAAPDLPVGTLMNGDTKAVAHNFASERVVRLADSVLACSELVITRVHGLVDQTPDGEVPKGLTAWATTFGIMVDKYRILQDTIAQMDGKQSSSVTELEKRIALLMAAQTEMLRRQAERTPVDVTPPKG